MSKFTTLCLLGLFPFAAAAALPDAAQAQNAPAQEAPTGAPFFTNCLYGFAIIFPERPQQRDINYATNNGKLQPAHQFFVEKGPNRYQVTVVDFFDGPKADSQIVEHAAANLKLRGALFHEDFATYDPGMPGHQLNIFETKERQIRASVYMAEHRLYIIEASASSGDIPAVQFEQSITLVDEMGWDLDRIAPNGEPSPRQFKCR
jgi:hypothetical protein